MTSPGLDPRARPIAAAGFWQVRPRLTGWCSSPRTPTSRPPATSVTRPQPTPQ